MTSGFIAMTADGNCSVGQFVIVSAQNAGHVQCSSSYVAGTVIGVSLHEEQGGGGISVQIGLR
jgi:hypothetical protein